jgi:hypothetical protein
VVARRRTKKSEAQKPRAKPANSAPRRGFDTIDYGDGTHGLMLVGSGYAWESIGRHVAKKLRITKQLHFDCEGSMFAVRSTDPAVLAKLQAALDPILADRDVFKRMVAQLGES